MPRLTSGPASRDGDLVTRTRRRELGRCRGAEEVDDDRVGRDAPTRATTACPSSWAIADARNRIATTTPIPHRTTIDEPGSARPIWAPTLTTRMARMMAHETWIRISRPASRPIGIVLIRAPRPSGSSPGPQPPATTAAIERTWATTPTTAEIAMIDDADRDRATPARTGTGRAGRAAPSPGRSRTSRPGTGPRGRPRRACRTRRARRRPSPTTAAASQNAPCRTARQVAALSFRRTAAMSSTITETTAAIARPPNTVRTSRMCPRSRSFRTGTPAIATSKSGGPTTRSARIAFVAVRRSASL